MKKIEDYIVKRKKPELPEGYFSELSDRIVGEHLKGKVERKKQNRPIFWLSAGAAAVVISFVFFLPAKTEVSSPKSAINRLTKREIKQYIAQNKTDFDNFQPVQKTSGKTQIPIKPAQVVKPNKSPSGIESLTKEDILSYLKDNDWTKEEFIESINL